MCTTTGFGVTILQYRTFLSTLFSGIFLNIYFLLIKCDEIICSFCAHENARLTSYVHGLIAVLCTCWEAWPAHFGTVRCFTEWPEILDLIESNTIAEVRIRSCRKKMMLLVTGWMYQLPVPNGSCRWGVSGRPQGC